MYRFNAAFRIVKCTVVSKYSSSLSMEPKSSGKNNKKYYCIDQSKLTEARRGNKNSNLIRIVARRKKNWRQKEATSSTNICLGLIDPLIEMTNKRLFR